MTCSSSSSSSTVEIKNALIVYSFSLVVFFTIFYIFVKIRPLSAFIISAIFSHITLNVIFFPTKLNFWGEFTSYTAMYSFIQFFTPLAVMVYALVAAFGDKRGKVCMRSIV